MTALESPYFRRPRGRKNPRRFEVTVELRVACWLFAEVAFRDQPSRLEAQE